MENLPYHNFLEVHRMEKINYEEEPYSTLSSAAFTTGRGTRSMPITPSSTETLQGYHSPTRFTASILSFDDW